MGFPKQLFGWTLMSRTIPHDDGTQSVAYQATWSRSCGPISRRREVAIMVDIRRNSYDNQSHAAVKVFDPTALKWNDLAHLGRNEMQVLKKHGEGRQVPLVTEYALQREADVMKVYDAFVSDENQLLQRATSILDAAI